jgi:Rrf2 family protein
VDERIRLFFGWQYSFCLPPNSAFTIFFNILACISSVICENDRKFRYIILGDLEMKISTTAHYGLIAAGYIAEQTDEGWVMASTISAKYNIPEAYLLRIMKEMVKSNIMRSKRGPGGGYILARPAKEITLLEIIEAVDGPIASQLELAVIANKSQFSVNMESVFVKASEKEASILGRAKLSKMIG